MFDSTCRVATRQFAKSTASSSSKLDDRTVMHARISVLAMEDNSSHRKVSCATAESCLPKTELNMSVGRDFWHL